MDIFKKTSSRSRKSDTSFISELGSITSTPYTQMAQGHLPVAGPGPSSMASARASNGFHMDGGVGSKPISAPVTNPGLTPEGGLAGQVGGYGNGNVNGRRADGGRNSTDSSMSDPARNSSMVDLGQTNGYAEAAMREEAARSSRNSAASNGAGSMRRQVSRLTTLPEGVSSPPLSGISNGPNGYILPNDLSRRQSNTGSIRSVNSVSRPAPEFGGPSQNSSSTGDFGRYPPHPATVRRDTITSTSSGSVNKLRRQESRPYTPTNDNSSHPAREFRLAKPEDPAEIEEMYRKVAQRRGLPMTAFTQDMNRLSTLSSSSRSSGRTSVIQSNGTEKSALDKMWEVVYSDARDAKRQGSRTTPEQYCGKFLNGKGDIQLKDVKSLTITLRTESTDWLKGFLVISGPQVLAKILSDLYKRTPRTKAEFDLEDELIKCFRAIFNWREGIADSVTKQNVLDALACSLSSPTIATRQSVLAMLHTSLTQIVPVGYENVCRAFENRQAVLNQGKPGRGRFEYWMEVLRRDLDGRGRMGSLVGASSEYRSVSMSGGPDQGGEEAFRQYCWQNIITINGLLRVPRTSDRGPEFPSMEVRTHRRLELERCGLREILAKMGMLGYNQVDGEIETYKMLEEEDKRDLARLYARKQLRDLRDPEDVFKAVMGSVEGTKASEYFLSAMRHLMLIKDDGDDRVRYFQLIDELVSGIVLDQKPGMEREFSSIMGIAVQRVFARYEDADRLENVLEQVAELETRNVRLQRDRERLKEELAGAEGGLVGDLKAQIAHAEDNLRIARGNADASKAQLDSIHSQYKEQIEKLYELIRALYRMLLEAQNLEEILPREDPVDPVFNRAMMMESLARHVERFETIQILQGTGRRRTLSDKRTASYTALLLDPDLDDQDDRVEILEPAPNSRITRNGSRRNTHVMVGKRREVVSGSAFADAEDNDVQAHIEFRLASEDPVSLGPSGHGVRLPSDPSLVIYQSPNRMKSVLPRSARSRNVNLDIVSPTTRKHVRPDAPAFNEKSIERYGALSGNSVHSRLVTELRNKHNSIMRSASAPGNLEELDPESPVGSESIGGIGKTLAAQLAARAKQLGQAVPSPEDSAPASPVLNSSSESNAAATTDPTIAKEEEDQQDGSPLPPTPPPMPSWLTYGADEDDDGPPPPPPPPPPPMPGAMPPPAGLPAGHPMAGGGRGNFLAGIAAGIKLRSASSVGSSNGGPPPPPGFMPSMKNGKRFSANMSSPAGDRRKDVAFVASKKMKQLQWEKVNRMQLDKTVWAQNDDVMQEELAVQLKRVDVWSDMEDEFKAREMAYDAVAKRRQEELKSVLPPPIRKRVEILMARNKGMTPEAMSERITAFDPKLCDQTFLSELAPLLPTPEQVSLLKQQSADTPDELSLLHPADRLMIKLIKIPHLADRLKGMLYKVTFEETTSLLESAVLLLQEACDDMRRATQFKALLQVILLMGNYMNGKNYNGGAYGFKIGSINRLVDTKSMNGQNLLHFLERTISTQFPRIQDFRIELEKPAEAHRVSYEELSSSSKELLAGLTRIRSELETNFVDLNDGYARRMFPFVAISDERIMALRDQVVAAGRAFNEVKTYYGEGDDRFDAASNVEVFGKPTSLEFFGIIKTFITSYDMCRAQNKAKDDAKASLDRRKQAERARAALTPQLTGNTVSSISDQAMPDRGVMDDLHARLLKQGTPRARRAERHRQDLPSTPSLDRMDLSSWGFDGLGEYSEAAQDLLAGISGGEGGNSDTVDATDDDGMPEANVKPESEVRLNLPRDDRHADDDDQALSYAGSTEPMRINLVVDGPDEDDDAEDTPLQPVTPVGGDPAGRDVDMPSPSPAGAKALSGGMLTDKVVGDESEELDPVEMMRLLAASED